MCGGVLHMGRGGGAGGPGEGADPSGERARVTERSRVLGRRGRDQAGTPGRKSGQKGKGQVGGRGTVGEGEVAEAGGVAGLRGGGDTGPRDGGGWR